MDRTFFPIVILFKKTFKTPENHRKASLSTIFYSFPLMTSRLPQQIIHQNMPIGCTSCWLQAVLNLQECRANQSWKLFLIRNFTSKTFPYALQNISWEASKLHEYMDVPYILKGKKPLKYLNFFPFDTPVRIYLYY